MSECRSEAKVARSNESSEPLLPDATSDDLEVGWGDDLELIEDDRSEDDRYEADRPPHYDDR